MTTDHGKDNHPMIEYGCLPDIEPGRCDAHALAEIVERFPWSATDAVVADAMTAAGLDSSVIAMSDIELCDAIEQTCAMTARLYDAGKDTAEMTAREDVLFAEHYRRAAR